MFDIILLIMSSMLEPPPIKLMPPIPPMLPIEPMEGIAPPPEDIMVEEEEDDDVDLKLEIVLPSSDCVVAAMLWLLAFSSFFTAVPSSVFDSCTASTMMMSSLVFKAKSSGAKPGSSSWIWNLSLLADTWMLWAASPSPAPATPIARALNSANLLSRPAPMLSFRSAKKGSEKKADLFDSSSCFSDILRLCWQGCTRKDTKL